MDSDTEQNHTNSIQYVSPGFRSKRKPLFPGPSCCPKGRRTALRSFKSQRPSPTPPWTHKMCPPTTQAKGSWSKAVCIKSWRRSRNEQKGECFCLVSRRAASCHRTCYFLFWIGISSLHAFLDLQNGTSTCLFRSLFQRWCGVCSFFGCDKAETGKCCEIR